ncbi:MAG TPA: hypothetical protein VFY85_07760 [Gemmatimonadaceae bacterium]|nr:hypothetical protein [Gemmatimonadaceae bacterium]
MRAPTRARTVGRLVLCGSLLLLGGCATLGSTLSGYATGRDGIARPQQRLRDALSRGDFAAALAWHEDDELLRRLDVGIASYYAAQFTRSASVLDSAALLADDRITASLSKDALALVTSDLARPYQPRRTERLFIPYYAMLAYARLEQWEAAAVEARRLSSLLAQYAEGRDDRDRSLHAAMHELAGAVFARSGESDDAAVARRAARALAPGYAALDSVGGGTSAASGAPGDSSMGDVLVVVERGYVAHRVTETMELDLGGRDRDSVRVPDGGWNVAHGMRQAPGGPLSAPAYVSVRSHHADVDDDDDDYHMTIAFPALRRSSRPWGASVRAGASGDTLGAAGVVAHVDDATAADARRELGAIIARAAARAAAKYAVVKAVRDRKGEVAGTLANLGASLLERADVRSWHLLPGELTLVRLRLPSGPQRVTLRVGDGAQQRTVDAGTVLVRAGSVALAPVRLWQTPPAAPIVPPDSLQPRP